VLVLEDFSSHFIESLDGPMWSVAVEWQIYFAFALLFVPMVRRFGFLATTVAAFCIGLLPTFAGALRHQGDWYPLGLASFWYLGLFMIGYAAASLSIDTRPSVVRQFDRLPWGTIAVVLAIGSAVGAAMLKPWTMRSALWPEDILIGIAFAAQFTADARARKFGRTTWFEWLFSRTPLIFLGAFSYSLYLVHDPVMTLVLASVRPGWTNPQVIACAALAAVSAVVVSYVVYRTIERPFLTSYRRRGDDRSLHSAKIVELPDAG
jgi:peptidoglycan/LPS O-acetylase OafA/YrhL